MDKWPCPEFRSGWDSYFKDKPDKPVMHYSVIAGWFGDHMVMPPGNFFTMFMFLGKLHSMTQSVNSQLTEHRVSIFSWLHTYCFTQPLRSPRL
jgi:hypothetical protein